MDECEGQGLGERMDGSCAHVIYRGSCTIPPIDSSHCANFRKHPSLTMREEAALLINRFCVDKGYDDLKF